MKYRLCIILLLLCCVTLSPAQDVTDNPDVKDSLSWVEQKTLLIDSLLRDPWFETTQVSLMVFDLDADSVVYRHNERQRMRPASTQKVITAVCTLDVLGGSHRMSTMLYVTGEVNSRTLKGDLYCVGGFDPMAGSDEVKAFTDAVVALHVDTIFGHVFADQSMKDSNRLGEGWCWDDKNPELAPLLYNRKDVFPQKLLQSLQHRGIAVVNSDSADSVSVSHRVPANARLLCRTWHTVEQILPRMMKESDNLYAESVFYQLCAATGQHPCSAKQGKMQIDRLLKQLGFNGSEYRIADGSGLSLYNYTTAAVEVALLRYAYSKQQIYNVLLPTLPVAGVDGTLKKRMPGTAAHRKVQAKTGSVSGVFTLAGYATASNGHRLCFAILNQGVQKGATARAFQDKVCAALCQ